MKKNYVGYLPTRGHESVPNVYILIQGRRVGNKFVSLHSHKILILFQVHRTLIKLNNFISYEMKRVYYAEWRTLSVKTRSDFGESSFKAGSVPDSKALWKRLVGEEILLW